MPRRRPRQEPAAFDRRVMEQQMQAITRLLAEQDFGSLDEANAFIQQHLAGGQPLAAAPTTALEEAQELIYEALETTGARRLALARRALERSPDCADAYVLLAEATGDPGEARALYEQGVRAGERALGPVAFRDDAGHFWGILETRPYMRARHGLAAVLWHLGEREAAIGHLRDLLRLNPGDNQGLRYTLATWLLATGDDAALEDLLGQYPEEGSATWAYAHARGVPAARPGRPGGRGAPGGAGDEPVRAGVPARAEEAAAPVARVRRLRRRERGGHLCRGSGGGLAGDAEGRRVARGRARARCLATRARQAPPPAQEVVAAN